MFNPFSGNMSLNGIFAKKCAIKNCTVLLRTFQVNVESICRSKTSEMSNPICQTFKTTKMNLLKVVFGKNINVKYCTFKYYCIHISVDSVTQRLLKPRYIYFIFVAVFSMEMGLFIRSAPDNYFVYSQDSTWVSYEQAKTVSRTFSFSRKYSLVVTLSLLYVWYMQSAEAYKILLNNNNCLLSMLLLKQYSLSSDKFKLIASHHSSFEFVSSGLEALWAYFIELYYSWTQSIPSRNRETWPDG